MQRKYKCHTCGYEWEKETDELYDNCIKCGTIFVEAIKNDKEK